MKILAILSGVSVTFIALTCLFVSNFSPFDDRAGAFISSVVLTLLYSLSAKVVLAPNSSFCFTSVSALLLLEKGAGRFYMRRAVLSGSMMFQWAQCAVIVWSYYACAALRCLRKRIVEQLSL